MILDFWTPKQLAGELGVTPQYIVQVIKGKFTDRELPAEQISGRWLISNEAAKDFIQKFNDPKKTFFTPGEVARTIGKSRAYVRDALTGYGGRREPRLAGVKRGDRWVIAKGEAERFIGEHGKVDDV